MDKETETEEAIRIKHIKYKDMDNITPYEKWRLIFALIQVIATLGVPFVVIALNEYLKYRR